ncbi:MAG: hypothetical protein WCF16_06985 [Alphaproteobacteria bacterium]
MIEVTIPNSAKADLAIPAGRAVRSARVRVTVEPATAAVLIYGGPRYDAPVRFNGPLSEGDVNTSSPTVHIQGLDGATEAKVYTVSWIEA